MCFTMCFACRDASVTDTSIFAWEVVDLSCIQGIWPMFIAESTDSRKLHVICKHDLGNTQVLTRVFHFKLSHYFDF